jgi:hypothetical protein
MANEQIVAIKITTDAAGANETVKGYKAQLREATAELVNMSMKFGETSKEAADAAKKVAKLKDSIGDAKALADTFNPDKKFVALGGALQGAVGGFSALQGAMGLFGGQSKDVEQALLKVQSVMALQQGISGVAGAMDSFKLLSNEIKGNVTKAFSTLKGGIAATGIGLLVISLGLLIANFDKVKTVVNNLIPGLGKVADFVGNLINKVTDFIGVTNEAQRASDRLIAANEKQIKKTNEFLDANADKYDAYTVRKIKANNDYREHENEILKDSTKTEAEKQNLLKQYRDKANREIAASDADRQSKVDEANQKAAEKNKAHNEKIAASNKAASDKKAQADKEAADKLKQFNDEVAQEKITTNDLIKQAEIANIKDTIQRKEAELDYAAEKENAKNQALYEKGLISLIDVAQREKIITEQTAAEKAIAKDAIDKAAAAKELTNTKALNDAKLLEAERVNKILPTDNPEQAALKIDALAKAKLDAETTAFQLAKANTELQKGELELLEQQHQDKIVGITDEASKAKMSIAEKEKEHRQLMLNAIASGLNSVSDIIGKDTAAGKALAVSASLINTYAAIAGQLKAFAGVPIPGYAIAQAIATGIAGFGAVKNIIATKIPGKGSGGSLPAGANVSAAIAPLTPQAATTTLDQQSINRIGQASSRAFVLETDVTNNQERIARLNRAARIN